MIFNSISFFAENEKYTIQRHGGTSPVQKNLSQNDMADGYRWVITMFRQIYIKANKAGVTFVECTHQPW